MPFTELTTRRLGPVRRFFVRHRGAMDAVVMVWFASDVLLNAALVTPTGRPLPPVLGLGAVGLVVLTRRRQRPILVTAAMTLLAVLAVVLTGTIDGFELGMALGVYAVAASRPVRTAWLTVAATMTASSLAIVVWQVPYATAALFGEGTEPARPTWETRTTSIIAVAFLTLLALSIGMSVRHRREHVAELVARGNALAAERDQRAAVARADERRRIAREMHDVVAHSLSVMIALADGAGAAMERTPDRSRAALDELSATGRGALADMRRVLGVLEGGDAPLGPAPGGGDLQALVDSLRTAGLPVRATGLATPLPADTGFQLAVYRIVQEALTNALRHAVGTAEVLIVLRRDAGAIEVEVTDTGAVLAPSPTSAAGPGHGLIGMQERAAVYGGSVEAGPWHGGWRVRAVLPWREDEG